MGAKVDAVLEIGWWMNRFPGMRPTVPPGTKTTYVPALDENGVLPWGRVTSRLLAPWPPELPYKGQRGAGSTPRNWQRAI